MSGAAQTLSYLSLGLTALVSLSAAGDERAGSSHEALNHAPEVLLERMFSAQREIEYEGTLVYLHGHQLATLRIAHRIHDGVSKESLLALSGPIRAVARNERGVTCMMPDTRSFSVPRVQHGDAVLRGVPFDFARIRKYYLLHALGDARIAGRDTDVVGIVPIDNYRYGYRYFIDRETSLPLKIDLMDDAAEPIEQVMFTHVEVYPPSAAPVASVPPATEDHHPQPPAEIRSRWSFSTMPPGFVVVTDPNPVVPAAAMEHLLVSDGIASASVYIEPGDDGGLNGVTRIGAITAAGRRIAGHHAIAIGEVPERTARLLLDGLKPPPPNQTD
ncbi:MAG: MucB/RseB C-terminal domain-containing protein [Thiohalocapsa sp.]